MVSDPKLALNLTQEFGDQELASRQVLASSQDVSFPYVIQDSLLGDLKIEVHEGVFSPEYFNGWKTFTKHFPCVSGKSVLEVGCGTGVTSIYLASLGAAVTAVDVSSLAVQNTQRNAVLNGVSLDVRLSDVYSAIDSNELFDVIYWNLPFMYIDDSYTFASDLERGLFDPGYSLTRRFLDGGKQYLAPGGFLLAGFGNFGREDLFCSLAKQCGYSISEITRESSFEIRPVEFILYELRVCDGS